MIRRRQEANRRQVSGNIPLMSVFHDSNLDAAQGLNGITT
jgi:hypothetical protein